jgi:intracellular sulfur oxidation DsrE/DsrF family protein
MRRRRFLRAFLAGGMGLFAASRAAAQTPATKAKRQRVVYHLDDVDKIAMALRNVDNHIEGTGGPGKADLSIVVIGPALAMFRQDKADGIMSVTVAAMQQHGVQFNACGNTMRGMKLELSDLLPGFVKAEQGGVVRLAELQDDGYAYIRP